ncbi:anthranilate N-methyltransferase-like isoform X2 [Arachis ipaensis]|uniref:anthranilate N-methyltransferase-like isoform X2 n=1 Tax=Arachis ipaensis TaxID=130454 RepID=UPI000A2B17F6|nr:anthranilate N-methyltransferase-like isoform X2 [Arachis ipaensis]
MALASHDSDAKLEKQEDDAFMFAQMACSVVVPMAVRTTIELGVFEIIAKEGEGAKLSAKDIVDRIGSNNPEAASMLDRVLRLLASHSLLSCSVVEDPESSNNLHHRLLYSLSPVSKYFVTDADGVSWGPSLAHLLDKVLYPCWSELKGAILEGGIPFNRVYGMNMFEYANIDPRFNEIFNKAMLTSSTISMKRILDVYKGFDHINKLVDVGGGLGATLNLITSKYPNIQGVNFDLPHVIENAPIYAGVEHIGGDMFESVPNGDAIFIKNILHDWDDEECLKILKNCCKAIHRMMGWTKFFLQCQSRQMLLRWLSGLMFS